MIIMIITIKTFVNNKPFRYVAILKQLNLNIIILLYINIIIIIFR